MDNKHAQSEYSPDVKNVRFQFGIFRMIVLTTATALVLAVSIRIDAHRITQGIAGAYLLAVVYWLIMRGPIVFGRLADTYKRRGSIRVRRLELEREIQLKRQAYESRGLTDDKPKL